MEKNDIVNHPSHYTDGKIEVIDFIDDKKLGFCLGNAVKYISRAGKKDPTKEIEDLEKAIWYINHHIKNLQNKQQTLGNSKEIADKVDKIAYTPIRGLRAKINTVDDIIPTKELTKTGIDKLKEEEDKMWDTFYDTMHALEPSYTREQFAQDLDKARQEVKREMPTLMDITKLYK